MGISYKTAWRWWSEGKLDAYQTETGTVIVREPVNRPTGVALYARVSSADQKQDMERQLERLQSYAIARGYAVNVHERQAIRAARQQAAGSAHSSLVRAGGAR